MVKLGTWLLILAVVIGVVLIAYALFTTPINANFSYGEGTGPSNLPGQYEVAFSGNAAGGFAPYSYTWTFGDGAGAAGPSVRHVYTLPGNFTVSMVVTDAAGHVVTASKSIQVPTTPPPTAPAASPAAPHVASPTISLVVLGLVLAIGATIFYFLGPKYPILTAIALIVLVLVAAFYVVMIA